jgi:FkbM family methyltransferase
MDIEAVNSKDGKVYWIEKGDNLYKKRLQAGQYQKSNWIFAQSLIDNWTRAIDVGTNNACNAVNYAEKFKIVDCFEPTPLAQQLWINTINDNQVKNCNLYKVGLGERQHDTEILIYEKNGGHNHLSHYDKNPRTNPQRSHKQRIPIKVETLDSYNFQDVGFIKIDVEGYERFVLEGAQTTIQRSRPTIQLELVAIQCRKFNYKAEDLIQWIRSWDYLVISKNLGQLDGEFKTTNNELQYQGQKLKGEMDLWFQPRERQTIHAQILDNLFEIN